jgi:hypothetical protein
MRFSRLVEVIDRDTDVSLNDYGCGYGALLSYLRARGSRVAYRGFDINAATIEAAHLLHANERECSFTSNPSAVSLASFSIASGVFNVKLDYPDEVWREYVLRTIDTLDSLSADGFAFNMLSTYSDLEKRRQDLYYVDPLMMFDMCKRRFSPRVALLHDYPLYEFTIVVRK